MAPFEDSNKVLINEPEMCQVDFITLELTQEQLVSLASNSLGGYMSDHSLEHTSCKVTSGDSRNSICS